MPISLARLERDAEYSRQWGATREDIQNARKVIGDRKGWVDRLEAGKVNLVGDRELYNTAAELTKIIGHKNPDRFFKDPSAINPQTGQLLNPPPAPATPPPDPKLLIAQAKAQSDSAIAAHQAQSQQQKAQNDAIHLQVKAQAEIELARVKAELDAKMAVLRCTSEGRDRSTADAAFVPCRLAEGEGRPPLCSGPEAARQIPVGRSSCLIFRWCLSTISRIFPTFHLFRSITIRSARTAWFSRRRPNRKASPNRSRRQLQFRARMIA